MDKKKSLSAVRSLASLFLVFTLVIAAIAGGPGTAAALDYEECAKDWITGSIVETAFDFFMDNPNHCLEIADGDHTKTSRTDQKAKWEGIRADKDAFQTTTNNRLQDTQTIAQTKGKIAIVNELNAGANRSQAEAAGKEAISDYYATIEKNVISDFNGLVIQANYTRQVELGETGSEASWIYHYVASSKYPLDIDKSVNVSLVNGTQANLYTFLHPDESNLTVHPDHGGSHGSVFFEGPEGNQTKVTGGSNGVHLTIFQEIRDQNSAARSNIGAYVDGVYNNFSAGEIDGSDLLKNDPTALYQEASTDKDSTGYYGYAAIQLAALGYSGNTTASHVVTVNASTENATTYEGTLFYTADDLTDIETGTTLNTSNHSGLFMMAVQADDGTASIEELNGNLTIDSATNVKTGEAVETTEIEKKVYDTTNASALEAELQALRELRQEYEDQATYVGSGSGPGIDVGLDIGSTELLIVVAGVGVFVLALFSRRD